MGILKKLTLNLLDTTKEGWSKDISEELFISKYEDLFRSISTEIFINRSDINSDHRADYYGYFESEEGNVASAILSITKTKVRKLTKVLNIHISPVISENFQEEDIMTIAGIYKSLISQFFALSHQNEGEVKVYARSEFELKTFKRVTEILRNAGNDIVAIEGHWMIINLS